MSYDGKNPFKVTRAFMLPGGVTSSTLTGNVTLTRASSQMLAYDPGGASRDVTLPAEEGNDGLWYEFYNTADAAENLVIKSDAPATIVTINRGEFAKVACTGSAWAVVASTGVGGSDFGTVGILTDVIAESTGAAGVTIDGVLIKDTTIDVNGTADAIILDADADTTISAPTDDQIDIEIGGADDFTFTANTFTALSGSTIATDTIAETTGGAGVTIDGAKILDAHIVDSVGFYDASAPTKVARIDVVNVTAGQTRILSAPDADVGLMGPMYVSTVASAAITGATETKAAFDTKKTIAANVLKAGSVIHIVAQGIHTATTGTETSDLSLEIGSVSITSDSGVDPADNDIFAYDVWLTVRTAGAGGTIAGYGRKRVGAVGTAEVPFILAETAIDTTTTNDVAVYIDRQATATDGDSARLDIMVVEIAG